MYKLYSGILFLLVTSQAISQEIRLPDIITSAAEELAADDTDPHAVSVYLERLYDLAENPVNLNSTSGNDMARLFFLSDFQIKAVEDYTRTTGKIVSIYELANIPGFDRETVEMMIPFIVLDKIPDIHPDRTMWRNTLLTNLSVKPGEHDSSSLGTQWRILTKYSFSAGPLAGGLTAEKDPGEKLLAGTPPLPDFLSAHLAYAGNGIIRKMIAGDYSARFGQGTGINTGFRTALTPISPDYMTARDEIRPYTSTDENNFFRGIAAEFGFKNIDISLFYSRKYIDATINSITGTSESYVTNFYKAGLHNTYSLLQKKDAVSETLTGASASYNLKNLRIGLELISSRLSLPVSSSDNNFQDPADFQGKRNNVYSVHYNSLLNRILLYGEFSLNDKNRYAVVQGVKLRPSDRLTVNILYRYYEAGYISLHGRGPGNNSTTGNEQGMLANFTFEAAKHLFISAGGDVYSFPWLKYRCSSPTQGKRQEVRIRYLPGENLILEASYSNRITMTDNQSDNSIPGHRTLTTKWLKASAAYSPTGNLTLKTRTDIKTADPGGGHGMLLLQDLNYRFRTIPLSLWTRFCIFNIMSWDARIYTYENDILYSFSIPALSGTGSRSYIMAKWEIADFAELRVKYGLTSLAAGNVSTDSRDELKIQFRVRF